MTATIAPDSPQGHIANAIQILNGVLDEPDAEALADGDAKGILAAKARLMEALEALKPSVAAIEAAARALWELDQKRVGPIAWPGASRRYREEAAVALTAARGARPEATHVTADGRWRP